MTVALYPGSFDPVTYGHIDIVSRAAKVFDELVVGIFTTPPKNLLFTSEERVELMKKAVEHIPNVRVEPYTDLTVNFAKRCNARVIVRGLRMGGDFEGEFEMALMIKKLAPEIEVMCMMTSAQYQFVSSSLLKEVAKFGGSVEHFVPEHVATALREKLRTLDENQH